MNKNLIFSVEAKGDGNSSQFKRMTDRVKLILFMVDRHSKFDFEKKIEHNINS